MFKNSAALKWTALPVRPVPSVLTSVIPTEEVCGLTGGLEVKLVHPVDVLISKYSWLWFIRWKSREDTIDVRCLG